MNNKIIEQPRVFNVGIYGYPTPITPSYMKLTVDDIVEVKYTTGASTATELISGRVSNETTNDQLVIDHSSNFQSKKLYLNMNEDIFIRAIKLLK